MCGTTHVMVAVAVEPPPPRSLVLGALASLVNALGIYIYIFIEGGYVHA